jgi:hypothetical protein
MLIAVGVFFIGFAILATRMLRANRRYLDRVGSPYTGDQSIVGFIRESTAAGRALDTPQDDPELERLRFQVSLAYRWLVIWAFVGLFPTLVLGGWIDTAFASPTHAGRAPLWVAFTAIGAVSVAVGAWQLRRPELPRWDRALGLVALVAGIAMTFVFAVLALTY